MTASARTTANQHREKHHGEIDCGNQQTKIQNNDAHALLPFLRDPSPIIHWRQFARLEMAREHFAAQDPGEIRASGDKVRAVTD